jgi:hypothetical protein
MKNLMRLTLIAPLLLVTACGGSSGSNAVEDLSYLREQAKLDLAKGPSNAPGLAKTPTPTPAPQPEKIVYVTKEKEVIKEQATLTDGYFKIDIADKMLSFYEGQASSYKITLRVLDPELQMKLTAKGLPAGAELKDVSTTKTPNAYELRWTPALYTISYDEQPPKMMSATLAPVFVSAKTAKKTEAVKGMSLEKTIIFSVLRNQDKPSELVVNGLATEVQEGQVVPFSVVAKFPGVDANAPVKPYLGRFKDNTNQVAGSNYLEMDGTRYASENPDLASVEYIGDYKWKFNLIFDTKNNPVEAQKSKDGSIAAVNFTQVRLGMRVFGAFNASPPTVVRVKIIRAGSK